MTRLIFLVLIGSLAAIAFGQDVKDIIPPERHNSTVAPPTPSPTTSTTSKTTTSATTPSTTSATTPSTTSATKPTSKTTTPTSTTSTEKPTTPVPPKPTPTPVPPKPVDPKIGTWHLNYVNSSDSCVLLEFALQIEVPYNTTNNKTFTASVNVPPNATISGSCEKDADHQTIKLDWLNAENLTDTLQLTFVKNTTSKVYSLTEILANLTVDNKDFPGIINDENVNLNHTHGEFRTGLTNSYKCVKKQVLNITDKATNKARGTLTVTNLQFQVFTNSTNQHFTDVEDCAPADTPDVVPIAVGCALAALVIVVLIAYLIGRRRGQARGYLSM